jgi:hypothetical protein
MTALRHDAHPGDYGLSRQKTPTRDCSHWCLPGVPDHWNQLLQQLLIQQIAPAPAAPARNHHRPSGAAGRLQAMADRLSSGGPRVHGIGLRPKDHQRGDPSVAVGPAQGRGWPSSAELRGSVAAGLRAGASRAARSHLTSRLLQPSPHSLKAGIADFKANAAKRHPTMRSGSNKGR